MYRRLAKAFSFSEGTQALGLSQVIAQLTTPGSNMLAWPKIKTLEAPTIQNIVLRGAASHSNGIPMTKRPV